MSILLNGDSRVLVQGITGREGQFHTQRMLDYGTNVVAGVTPGRGGEWVHGIPVFDSVREAVEATGAQVSAVFVPARSAADSIGEAAYAGCRLIVCATEGIPVHDVVRLRPFLAARNVRLIGPSSPGIVVPGVAKVGMMPGGIHAPGNVGVISRSGSLAYEIVAGLTRAGLGQSTVVGIGGDYVVGTGFVELLELFDDDPDTEQVVLIGEIGGLEEQLAAAYIGSHMSKPVVAYVAGLTAPSRRRIGHPGAMADLEAASAQEKIAALRAAGVRVAEHPAQVAELVRAHAGEGA